MTANEFLKSKGAQTDAHVFPASEIEKWLTEYAQQLAVEARQQIWDIYTGGISAGTATGEAISRLNEVFGFPEWELPEPKKRIRDM